MSDTHLSICEVLQVCIEHKGLPDLVRGACQDAKSRIENLERELQWMADQWDDSLPSYELTPRLYDVRCTAIKLLQSEMEWREVVKEKT